MTKMPVPEPGRRSAERFVDCQLSHLVADEVRGSETIAGGQTAADAALASFDVTGYARSRNTVEPIAARGASGLSPYIRHGLLQLRGRAAPRLPEPAQLRMRHGAGRWCIYQPLPQRRLPLPGRRRSFSRRALPGLRRRSSRGALSTFPQTLWQTKAGTATTTSPIFNLTAASSNIWAVECCQACRRKFLFEPKSAPYWTIYSSRSPTRSDAQCVKTKIRVGRAVHICRPTR